MMDAVDEAASIRTAVANRSGLDGVVCQPGVLERFDGGLEPELGVVALAARLVELGHADADDWGAVSSV